MNATFNRLKTIQDMLHNDKHKFDWIKLYYKKKKLKKKFIKY